MSSWGRGQPSACVAVFLCGEIIWTSDVTQLRPASSAHAMPAQPLRHDIHILHFGGLSREAIPLTNGQQQTTESCHLGSQLMDGAFLPSATIPGLTLHSFQDEGTDSCIQFRSRTPSLLDPVRSRITPDSEGGRCLTVIALRGKTRNMLRPANTWPELCAPGYGVTDVDADDALVYSVPGGSSARTWGPNAVLSWTDRGFAWGRNGAGLRKLSAGCRLYPGSDANPTTRSPVARQVNQSFEELTWAFIL